MKSMHGRDCVEVTLEKTGVYFGTSYKRLQVPAVVCMKFQNTHQFAVPDDITEVTTYDDMSTGILAVIKKSFSTNSNSVYLAFSWD